MIMALRIPVLSAFALALSLPAAGWAADPHAGHVMPAPAPVAAGQTFKAALTGTTEVPGPGDADGSGTATVTVDTAKGQLCYTVQVAMVDRVTMAHIHKGRTGSMGDVVFPFTAPTTGASQGCATVRPELAAAILADPTDFYVNVHSEANPAGAVRGQLGK
jgi:hypothetical protein